MPPPCQGEDVRRPPTVHVEKRHGVKVHIAVSGSHAHGGVEGVHIKIAMRQHNPLGMRRGAAGVKKLGYGILINLAVIDIRRVRFGK